MSNPLGRPPPWEGRLGERDLAQLYQSFEHHHSKLLLLVAASAVKIRPINTHVVVVVVVVVVVWTGFAICLQHCHLWTKTGSLSGNYFSMLMIGLHVKHHKYEHFTVNGNCIFY